MVPASEVPLTIQQVGRQLARKSNSMGSIVDATNSAVKLRGAASNSNTKMAPKLRCSEVFQEFCAVVRGLANFENEENISKVRVCFEPCFKLRYNIFETGWSTYCANSTDVVQSKMLQK